MKRFGFREIGLATALTIFPASEAHGYEIGVDKKPKVEAAAEDSGDVEESQSGLTSVASKLFSNMVDEALEEHCAEDGENAYRETLAMWPISNGRYRNADAFREGAIAECKKEAFPSLDGAVDAASAALPGWKSRVEALREGAVKALRVASRALLREVIFDRCRKRSKSIIDAATDTLGDSIKLQIALQENALGIQADCLSKEVDSVEDHCKDLQNDFLRAAYAEEMRTGNSEDPDLFENSFEVAKECRRTWLAEED